VRLLASCAGLKTTQMADFSTSRKLRGAFARDMEPETLRAAGRVRTPAARVREAAENAAVLGPRARVPVQAGPVQVGGAGVSGASAGGGCGEGRREGEPPPTEPSDASRATGGAPVAKRHKKCAHAAAPAPAAEKKADSPKAADAPADAPKTKKKDVRAICVHGKRKALCAECGGNGLCDHGKDKRWCKACGGSALCEHGKDKRWCKACPGGGSAPVAIKCTHGKRKVHCRECAPASFCQHDRRKAMCRECAPVQQPAVVQHLTGEQFTAHMVQKVQKLRGRAAECKAALDSLPPGDEINMSVAYYEALMGEVSATAQADKIDGQIRDILADYAAMEKEKAAMEKEPDTFQLTEAAGKSAKGKGKKNAEASSKASTPTKDGENAENAAVDEEPKVCLCVDMRAHIHAQCCCALRPVLPGRSRRRHCPPAPAPPSGVARAGWRLRALARARAQL